MKTIGVIFFFINLSAFAGKPMMATLKPTEIKLSVENLSEEKIEDIILSPRLACQTTEPEGGGESYTDTNTADLKYTVEKSASPTEFVLKITDPAEVSAPKKVSLRAVSTCYADLYMTLEINGVRDYFVPYPGYVKSKKANTDFTVEFKKELEAQYYTKLVDGGTKYDSELGHRVPYCRLGLFKHMSNTDKYLGFALIYIKSRCDLSH